MKKNLPILEIFLEATSLPFKHYRTLLKVGFPLIILNGLNIVFSHFSDNQNSSLIALNFIWFFVISLSLVMAIIGCHRVFLLGDNVVKETSLFHWTRNEIKYIGWWVWIGLCTSFFTIPFLLIDTIPIEQYIDHKLIVDTINNLIYLPLYYLISRWSLVFPSSSIDIHGKDLTWSWNLSAGNGLRLTILISLAPFLANFIFSLLPQHSSLFLSLVEGTIWLVIGVIEVGLLSLSYQFLINNNAKNIDEIP